METISLDSFSLDNSVDIIQHHSRLNYCAINRLGQLDIYQISKPFAQQIPADFIKIQIPPLLFPCNVQKCCWHPYLPAFVVTFSRGDEHEYFMYTIVGFKVTRVLAVSFPAQISSISWINNSHRPFVVSNNRLKRSINLYYSPAMSDYSIACVCVNGRVLTILLAPTDLLGFCSCSNSRQC